MTSTDIMAVAGEQESGTAADDLCAYLDSESKRIVEHHQTHKQWTVWIMGLLANGWAT